MRFFAMKERLLLLAIFVVYIAILTVALLWPFDFDFDFNRDNNARWIKNINGIQFEKKGMLITKKQPSYLFSKLTKGTGLTIEIWVKAYNSLQDGPARIISYSLNPYLRNFTLAQSKDKLIMRLRTTQTDLNGISPHLELPNVFDELGVQYIVVTFGHGQECVYINGQLRKCEGRIRGNFSNWNPTYKLAIGNEVTGFRPWLGAIFYAAVYNRAITGKEVINHFANGQASAVPLKSDAAPVVCYLFNERAGTTISDGVQNASSADLYIPEKLPPIQKKLFQLSDEIISHDLEPLNVVRNFIGFVPLGFLLYGVLRTFSYSKGKSVLFALVTGVLVAISGEYLDYFLPGRHSSAIELSLKTMGAWIGVLLYSVYVENGRLPIDWFCKIKRRPKA